MFHEAVSSAANDGANDNPMLDLLANPEVWIAFFTLTMLEIVLDMCSRSTP